jgi:benzylsuccinate CoA-transferase BbsF subunit
MTAYTGLASVTGQDGGEPSRSIAGVWSDHLAGFTSLFGILVALEHRERTGEGQMVEYSMSEAVAAQILEAFIQFGCTGVAPGPIGNRDLAMCPHGIYPAAGEDRWIAIAVQDDDAWKQFARVVGNRAWQDDPELAALPGRLAHRAALDAAVGEWTRGQDPAALAAMLQAAGVSAGNVQNVRDLLEDPLLAGRGFFVEPVHPALGPLRHAGLPWAMACLEGVETRHPPMLGEHNWELLVEWLGMDVERFSELVASGVIV